jgi:thiamine-phosphate pyrophosphorylase
MREREIMASATELLRLMVVTDRSLCSRPLVEAVEAALRGGANAVMLREKDLPAQALYELAVALREATRRAGALLIVNDRADVALAAGADGVHLGWQSLRVAKTREIVGRDRLIGVSTHSAAEVREAERAGADYVTFGPVFSTPSKAGLVAVQGLDGLRRACQGRGIPLIAIGGIDAANAGEVVSAGADGVAAIRAILAWADPEQCARRISGQIENARRARPAP